jgi:hypothetical protein
VREKVNPRSGAPDALLGVERGEHYGLVVDAGGMEIDGGGGLRAEVSVARVEIECADLVGAAGASELHAALDASDGVVSSHHSSVVFWRESVAHVGEAAKVMQGRAGEGSNWDLGRDIPLMSRRRGNGYSVLLR